MSNNNKWCIVNTPEQQGTAFDVSSFCTSMSESEPSPIDDFYTYSRDIIKLGSPSRLTENPILGRLLLLALVSGVELYFRSILSGIIKHCPIARKHAFKQQISLENVEYYGFDEISKRRVYKRSVIHPLKISRSNRSSVKIPNTEASIAFQKNISNLNLRGLANLGGFWPKFLSEIL